MTPDEIKVLAERVSSDGYYRMNHGDFTELARAALDGLRAQEEIERLTAELDEYKRMIPSVPAALLDDESYPTADMLALFNSSRSRLDVQPAVARASCPVTAMLTTACREVLAAMEAASRPCDCHQRARLAAESDGAE